MNIVVRHSSLLLTVLYFPVIIILFIAGLFSAPMDAIALLTINSILFVFVVAVVPNISLKTDPMKFVVFALLLGLTETLNFFYFKSIAKSNMDFVAFCLIFLLVTVGTIVAVASFLVSDSEDESDNKSTLPNEYATELKQLEERLIESEEDRFIPRAEAIWREVEVGASNYNEMKQELDELIKEKLMELQLAEATKELLDDYKRTQANEDILSDLKNL